MQYRSGLHTIEWNQCAIEEEQRRMTKMIQEIRNLIYKDRSKHFNLHSLARCRIRGDLIDVLK